MKRGWLSFYFLSKAPRPVRIPTHKLWVFEKINILYFLNFLLWNHTHSRRHIKRKRIVWRITANTRIAITAVKIRTGLIPGGPLHPAVLPALGPPRDGAPRGRTRRSLPFPVYSLVASARPQMLCFRSLTSEPPVNGIRLPFLHFPPLVLSNVLSERARAPRDAGSAFLCCAPCLGKSRGSRLGDRWWGLALFPVLGRNISFVIISALMDGSLRSISLNS